LVVTERALFADADEGRGADIGIAYWAFAIAFIAEATNGDARLLAAHYEITGEGGLASAKKVEALPAERLTDDGET